MEVKYVTTLILPIEKLQLNSQVNASLLEKTTLQLAKI